MTRQIKFAISTCLITLLTFGVFSVGQIPLAAASQDGTGGAITHVGGYTIHTFTSGGTFNPGPDVSSVTYLVVGGGGGGGGTLGGGGGGGGVLTGTVAVTPNQNYSVVVGAGGAGGANGTNGSNSSFNGNTAVGGGAGGGNGSNGSTGGSGGGGNYNPSLPGGSGTAGQGNSGSVGYGGFPQFGGGGGGASVAPSDTPTGGNGLTSSISGSAQVYGGGGGGGSVSIGDTGGTGGGGAGANRAGSDSPTAGANTGGGGGGGDFGNGANGGTGVVIITYAFAGTCTGYSLAATWAVTGAGTVQASITGVSSNVTGVAFFWWSALSGESDLRSDNGTNAGGGTWTYNVPLSGYSYLGQIMVYAAMLSGAGWTGCLPDTSFMLYNNTGTITVNSVDANNNPFPTSWTITCTLTNPTCPTYSSGPNQTSGSYSSVPYNSQSGSSPYPSPPWTITPATILGYTATVTPSNPQNITN